MSFILIVYIFHYILMGIGDGGLGIGPNPQSPIPNPQSPIPIPNPQDINNLELLNFYLIKNKIIFILFTIKNKY